MQNAEIEDEARSKHIARLDFFKAVRSGVEEVGNPQFWVFHEDEDGDDGDYGDDVDDEEDGDDEEFA